MVRALVFLLVATLPSIAREFDPKRDGFSFANETVLAYGVDEGGRLQMRTKEKPAEFAHRCICMTRAALQFWKFARFEPKQAKLPAAEYRRRVRQLFRIPVWFSEKSPSQRVIIPGYKDVWSFSLAQRRLVQEEIGAWFPTYARPGNWRMPCPFIRYFQGSIARSLRRAIKDQPQAVFVAKFPSMNHALIAYKAQELPNGRTRFTVYDPNYPAESAWLDYDPEPNLFEFQPRFYWPGGYVRAFRIYLSPVH